MSAQPLVTSLKDIDKKDIGLVGGKAANLGEMIGAGFPVPLGFAVTVESYDLFLKENGLDLKIYKILDKTDVENPEELNNVSKDIQSLILKSEIPQILSSQIITHYKRLSGLFKKATVAVRSSATAEDMPGTSFAGQQASFLDITGEANVLQKVKECWASLFTSRSIFYRVQNKIHHDKVKIAVVVQKMIQSEVSGVMFTVDPVTNDKEKIIIESVWGLGEMIVQGAVLPDKYVIQKDTFAILSKDVSDQAVQLIKVKGEAKEAQVPDTIRDKQKISNEEIIWLAKIGDRLQKHYYYPQDVEWAKEKDKLYIVQTRPVTTLTQKLNSKKSISLESPQASSPILTGVAASPGIGTGRVRILKSPDEIAKVEKGDVLVAPMTSPDYVPAMKKAEAIVTDQGGLTSHAAIVSRELGIPCVVGTKVATSTLKEGAIISVNGSSGEIFEGSAIEPSEKLEKHIKPTRRKTATKLYVNLGEPELASKVSKLNVDGVGLLRAEFMIANIGMHPKTAIADKKQNAFIERLSKDLSTFCKSFDQRPVVYRATDFRSNEYRALKGGDRWEPEETNPMLGFRGAYRYISQPEVFNLELQAIKQTRKKYKNLHLMIPFVRSPQELAKVRRIVQAEDLFEDSSFKFWMMVEIPVNVFLIEDFIKVGIDGVSIGSNDLTMLIHGVDRDNSDVAAEYDERSPAVLKAIRRVIRVCSKNGVTSSICGQAPSVYDDLVELLIKTGITSISVNPDAIDRVRRVIMNTEDNVNNF